MDLTPSTSICIVYSVGITAGLERRALAQYAVIAVTDVNVACLIGGILETYRNTVAAGAGAARIRAGGCIAGPDIDGHVIAGGCRIDDDLVVAAIGLDRQMSSVCRGRSA